MSAKGVTTKTPASKKATGGFVFGVGDLSRAANTPSTADLSSIGCDHATGDLSPLNIAEMQRTEKRRAAKAAKAARAARGEQGVNDDLSDLSLDDSPPVKTESEASSPATPNPYDSINVSSFSELGLPAELVKYLVTVGLTQTNDFESQAFGAFKTKHDMLCVTGAKKGIGKTSFAVISAIASVLKSTEITPCVLIISPDMERSKVLEEEIEKFGPALTEGGLDPVRTLRLDGNISGVEGAGVQCLLGAPTEVMAAIQLGLELDSCRFIIFENVSCLDPDALSTARQILVNCSFEAQTVFITREVTPEIKNWSMLGLTTPLTVDVSHLPTPQAVERPTPIWMTPAKAAKTDS